MIVKPLWLIGQFMRIFLESAQDKNRVGKVSLIYRLSKNLAEFSAKQTARKFSEKLEGIFRQAENRRSGAPPVL